MGDAVASIDGELREHALFTALTDDQLARAEQHASFIQLDAGEHLFEQGQRADRFFLVRSGQLKLYRLSPSGHEKVIEIVRPGQTFAEAVMFMDIKDYPVNAEAVSPAEVVAFSNRVFLGILQESQETCLQMLGDMSVRLRQLLAEIDALTLQNATLRLVNYLLYEIPEGAEESAEINLPAPKNIIASRLSVQPETLSRILHNLSDAGLINVKGLHITVNDIDGLRSWAQ